MSTSPVEFYRPAGIPTYYSCGHFHVEPIPVPQPLGDSLEVLLYQPPPCPLCMSVQNDPLTTST